MRLTQKRIERYIEKLKKYCHKPRCKDWGWCPEDCKCEPKLDFDTAIAWELADDLYCLLNELPEYDLDFLEYTNNFIGYLLSLKSYHSVMPKYKKLFEILDPLNRDFIETIFYPKKANK